MAADALASLLPELLALRDDCFVRYLLLRDANFPLAPRWPLGRPQEPYTLYAACYQRFSPQMDLLEKVRQKAGLGPTVLLMNGYDVLEKFNNFIAMFARQQQMGPHILKWIPDSDIWGLCLPCAAPLDVKILLDSLDCWPLQQQCIRFLHPSTQRVPMDAPLSSSDLCYAAPWNTPAFHRLQAIVADVDQPCHLLHKVMCTSVLALRDELDLSKIDAFLLTLLKGLHHVLAAVVLADVLHSYATFVEHYTRFMDLLFAILAYHRPHPDVSSFHAAADQCGRARLRTCPGLLDRVAAHAVHVEHFPAKSGMDAIVSVALACQQEEELALEVLGFPGCAYTIYFEIGLLLNVLEKDQKAPLFILGLAAEHDVDLLTPQVIRQVLMPLQQYIRSLQEDDPEAFAHCVIDSTLDPLVELDGTRQHFCSYLTNLLLEDVVCGGLLLFLCRSLSKFAMMGIGKCCLGSTTVLCSEDVKFHPILDELRVAGGQAFQVCRDAFQMMVHCLLHHGEGEVRFIEQCSENATFMRQRMGHWVQQGNFGPFIFFPVSQQEGEDPLLQQDREIRTHDAFVSLQAESFGFPMSSRTAKRLAVGLEPQPILVTQAAHVVRVLEHVEREALAALAAGAPLSQHQTEKPAYTIPVEVFYNP
eukprot:GGOE01037322.1.p1 GENE.GGOE01037322.1~~GGOE01037322.1.p1  ORF type:complete len:644 (-),score=189.18 GGOE01037322.1:150-2081(-)